ncbi:hypothetical protein Tco_1234460 [Tanacetum coccineum]
MDDTNITIEEYIRLEEEKARRCGKVFNWKTAKYGKIRINEDVHNLRSVETKFPAITLINEISSETTLSCEPTVSSLNNEVDFRISFDVSDVKITRDQDMAFPPRDQRHQYLRYEGLQYTDADIADFEERLRRIYSREIHRVQVMDFQGMAELMRDALYDKMLIEHRDDGGAVVFTSRAWRRLFDTRGPLLEGARRGMSWRQFIAALGLHTREEMESPGFAKYWSKNPVVRLYHRMMAHSIAGRSQAPEKVTMTDLFYLRGLDVGSFVAQLAEHFGLLTEERLHGLTVIMRELLVIDMAKLVRLQICEEIDDTWSWVALGQERQPDAAAGAPGAAEDAPAVDEGDQAVLEPVQAPPSPPAAARTMPQRMARLAA